MIPAPRATPPRWPRARRARAAGPRLGLLLALAAGCSCRGERTPAGAAGEQRPEDPGALQALLARVQPRPPVALSDAQASRLVALSLRCVNPEYPNKPSDVQSGDQEVRPPRALHPAFYGCFDWHSAVHGHWAMARVLRRFPGIPAADALRKALDQHLAPGPLAGEVAYFTAPHHAIFERPYGWGWLLRLVQELHTFDDPDACRWREALRPLEELLVRQLRGYLQRLSVPVREGTHASTAFTLAHVLDYARAVGDDQLRGAAAQAARRFYLQDRGCPTDFEPSGEDFISPCLAEADLMRRVLPAAEFGPWLERFLPSPASGRLAPLLRPPEVRVRRDPRIGHLIGLSLQRAWSMRGVAGALPAGAPLGQLLLRLADLHRDHALGLMFDSGYGGEHWLASFAIYLLTDVGLAPAAGGIKESGP